MCEDPGGEIEGPQGEKQLVEFEGEQFHPVHLGSRSRENRKTRLRLSLISRRTAGRPAGRPEKPAKES